jgi:hypothetical protein
MAIVRAVWIRSIEKSNDLIGNRPRDLPACSIVPQPTTLPREPMSSDIYKKEFVSCVSETCRTKFQFVCQ